MYWPSASFGLLADCSDRTRSALDRPGPDFGLDHQTTDNAAACRHGVHLGEASHLRFMQSTSPTDDRLRFVQSALTWHCLYRRRHKLQNNQSLLTLAILSGSIPAFARVLFALSQKAREYLRFSSTHHGFPTTPRWDTCASIRRAYFDRRNAPI